MARFPLDIGMDTYKNVSELSTRDGVSPIAFDCYKNEFGSDVKRHGYKQFCNLDTGERVDGLWWSKSLGQLFAVSGGSIYRVNENGNETNLGAGMNSHSRVNFVEDENRVYMANGGTLIYSDGSTITEMNDTDGDAPVGVIGLGMVDTYLVAATEKQVHFANASNPLSWGVLNYYTPESNPDEIRGLLINHREVQAFGTDTVDVYYNDGTSPFSRLDGAFSDQLGLLAPDSLVKIKNGISIFLDHQKEVTLLTGRQPQTISNKINKELHSYNVAEDAIGNYITMNGKSFYVLTFPTEQITWTYDLMLQIWLPWSYWNDAYAIREAFNMASYIYVPEWNKYLIGSLKDGKIYDWSPNYYSDDGDVIRYQRRTGHTNHGTYENKFASRITMKVKRGVAEEQVNIYSNIDDVDAAVADIDASSIDNIDTYRVIPSISNSHLMLKWRNDGLNWSNEKKISLGKDAHDNILANRRSLGYYKTRQYEIIHTDKTPFELCNPIEEFVDLGSSREEEDFGR